MNMRSDYQNRNNPTKARTAVQNWVSKGGIALVMLLISCSLSGQGLQSQFGKNRVQYHEFEWSFYETSNFIVYFYQGGQQLGKYVMKSAEGALPEIEGLMEHHLSSKIEILLYHNHSDLTQTNIGIGLDVPNAGGTTKIVGNKVFVYYNGDHEHLAKQVREGIARVHLENMVFGSNIQEMVQNAVLLNLPEWFTEGLVAYIGEEWNVYLDDQLQDALKDERLSNYNRLQPRDFRFAGHTLWHYIGEVYGKDNIPNLLYLTRVNRSVESGVLFVLGLSIKELVAEMNVYYANQLEDIDPSEAGFKEENLTYKPPRRKKDWVVTKAKLDPAGKYLSYSTNQDGVYRIYLKNLETDEKERILKAGFQTFDLPYRSNYPIMTWDKKGKQLAIIYSKRDVIRLRLYKPEDGTVEEFPITKFQQVMGASFTNDSRKLVLSAMRRGQADLFTYFIPSTKVVQLTNDFYDDLQPQYVNLNGTEGVAFISNRHDDTLRVAKFDSIYPAAHYDVFFKSLEDNSDYLTRVTNTPYDNEQLPKQYDEQRLCYMSDANGVNNIYLAALDTQYVRTDMVVYMGRSKLTNPSMDVDSLMQVGAVDSLKMLEIYKAVGNSSPHTNFKKNALYYDYRPDVSGSAEIILRDGVYHVYTNSIVEGQGEWGSLNSTFYKYHASQKPLEDRSVPLPEAEETIEEPEKVVVIEEEVIEPIDVEEVKVEELIDSVEVNESEYYFQSEFDYFSIEEDIVNNGDSTSIASQNTSEGAIPVMAGQQPRAGDVKLSRVRTYRTRFAVDYLVTQLDNTVIFNDYENFNLSGAGFFNPDLKALIRLGTSDLFEDYKIIGGFRLPVGLSGTEYFLEYQALKKRIDKRILLYRKADTKTDNVYDPLTDSEVLSQTKTITKFGQVSLSYPLDIVQSFRLHTGYRNDKLVPLAIDSTTLRIPTQQEHWLQMRLEYVYDNTLDLALNIKSGTRLNIYTELRKPFDASFGQENFDFKFKDTGFLMVVGGDLRFYKKIHKHMIWATRLAFAKSFGSRRIVYYLGGVDNWLQFNQEKRFDFNTPIDPNAGYAYQAVVPNLRGFKYNVRNGSGFALINTELRIPVFSTLINLPIKSGFFRNFQVAAFADLGTAWEGISPFSKENFYNTYEFDAGGSTSSDTEPQSGPVLATVEYYQNPLIFGYGFGVRSKLLGYFIKMDVGWGIDSGHATKATWYFSLGTDF